MKKEHLKVRRDPERRLVWWEHGCAEEGDTRREASAGEGRDGLNPHVAGSWYHGPRDARCSVMFDKGVDGAHFQSLRVRAFLTPSGWQQVRFPMLRTEWRAE